MVKEWVTERRGFWIRGGEREGCYSGVEVVFGGEVGTGEEGGAFGWCD